MKNGTIYYYLRYNTKYLGKKIPENIDVLKREFDLEMNRRQWVPILAKIRTEYVKKPRSQRIQDLEEFSYHFTHDTQKIEGSTLTQKETYNLLRFHLTPAQKPETDMIEAQLHHKVFTGLIQKPPVLTEKTVLEWHRIIFGKTKPEIAGNLRSFKVYVTNSKSRFPHDAFVPALTRDFFKWLKTPDVQRIHPVELAGTAHFRFVNIHPFGDGNGRISRLLMNHILIKNDYPALNIRFIERMSYYKALEKGNLQNDEIFFIKWFMKRYIAEYKKHYL